jgi:hypothetical protein
LLCRTQGRCIECVSRKGNPARLLARKAFLAGYQTTMAANGKKNSLKSLIEILKTAMHVRNLAFFAVVAGFT